MWQRELQDILRGAAGGFLFGIPLLYTVEVWSIGSATQPSRLLIALGVTFIVVLLLTPEAWRDCADALLKALPPSHLAFLSHLRLHVTVGDYCFVHAGIRPGIAFAEQDEEDLLWIRGDFLQSSSNHGKIVVHGHTVAPKPVVRSNRIGIDTGAYRSGRLTCLVLERHERRFLSTG